MLKKCSQKDYIVSCFNALMRIGSIPFIYLYLTLKVVFKVLNDRNRMKDGDHSA